MKKSLLIICISLIGGIGFANTQKGIVKTKGRLNTDQTITKGVPLPDAFVTVQGAQTVSSNKKGLFSVTLTSKDYYLKDVNKDGYVLCDADILSRAYAYSPNPLYIIMETPAQQMEDKVLAERKLRRTLQRQLAQREEEIDSLKARQQISEEDYHRQLQQIYADQEENERLIKEMADRYASIDYDQLDEYNRQISALILEGKLAEADSLIRTKGDITSRIETLKEHQDKNQQEEQALKKRMKALEKSIAYTRKEMEDLAQDCYSLYEIFKMQHKNDSAAYYLELRASLDTTYFEWVNEAGLYNNYLAHYSKALYYFQLFLQQAKLQLGDTSDVTASAYNNVGNTYERMGEYDKAAAYYATALQIRETMENADLGSIAVSYNNVGTIYYRLANYKEALKYFHKTLSIEEKIFGQDHIYVALDLNNIANVYQNIGDYKEALECYKKSLEILKNVVGEEDNSIAILYNNIGKVYYDEAKYNEAIEYYIQSLNLRIKLYGEEHPDVAQSYSNIGVAYCSLENYALAEEYGQKSLAIRKKTLGDSHPDIASDLINLGKVYCKIGNYDKALELLSQALTINLNKLGDNHPLVARTYVNLGAVYEAQGEKIHAIEYYTLALNIFRGVFGEEHTETKMVLHKLDSIKSTAQ